MSRGPRSADLTVVTISPAAYAAMHELALRSSDGRETGGILLGHEHPDRIHITTCGDPGPAAVRSPTRFRRDLSHAQDLANQAYARDQANWVGEWHTHPTGPARPSPLDLHTYQDILTDPELSMTVFIAIIIGTLPIQHARSVITDRPGHSDGTDPAPLARTQAWVIDPTTAILRQLHLADERGPAPTNTMAPQTPAPQSDAPYVSSDKLKPIGPSRVCPINGATGVDH